MCMPRSRATSARSMWMWETMSRRGQTLAILEIPELDAQLQGASAAIRRSRDAVRRAKSDLDRAESLHQATHLDYARLKQASSARPGLIAEQELDNAMAKDKEGEAQISADEAALSEAQNQLDVAIAEEKQLSAMSDYARIVAPFDGVITRRNVDTGALVQAGTNSNTQALPGGQRGTERPVPANPPGAGIRRSDDPVGHDRHCACASAEPRLRRESCSLCRCGQPGDAHHAHRGGRAQCQRRHRRRACMPKSNLPWRKRTTR